MLSVPTSSLQRGNPLRAVGREAQPFGRRGLAVGDQAVDGISEAERR
jgi:hypothetical protein